MTKYTHDELEDLVEENVRLSEENNRLIKRLYQNMVFGRIFKVLYWLVIIGIAIGAFYYIQPYLESLLGIYGQMNGVRESFPFGQ